MASININVTLDNGTSFSGAATMKDNAPLLEIAQTLAGLITESARPVPAPEGSTP